MTTVPKTDYLVTINGIEIQAQFYEKDVQEIFLPFLRELTVLQKEKDRRILVMLAAPPGAGKSTLLSFLEKLSKEREEISSVQIIGMDGFHRRQDDLLSHTTMRDGQEIKLVEIKGAPITFDLEKLTEKVRLIASGEVCGFPIYDRLLHNPVEDAVTVDGGIVILEGNYLLLGQDGWRELSGYADYTIFLRVEEELLRKRLIDRKMKTGVSQEKAEAFVDFSDMEKARLVLHHSKAADLTLHVEEDGSFIKKVH